MASGERRCSQDLSQEHEESFDLPDFTTSRVLPSAALASQPILVYPLLLIKEWVIDQCDAVTSIGRGERIMSTPAGSTLTSEQPHSEVSPIHTTLYDLIEALSQEVGPGEDHLVTAALVHLINSGGVKFADDGRELRVILS
jgi:hypothetical protein